MADVIKTKHTCTADGSALPFGRKAPPGDCARCDELRDGAPPRTLDWVDRKRQRDAAEAADRTAMARNVAAGLCLCGKPKDHAVVCTAFDW